MLKFRRIKIDHIKDKLFLNQIFPKCQYMAKINIQYNPNMDNILNSQFLIQTNNNYMANLTNSNIKIPNLNLFQDFSLNINSLINSLTKYFSLKCREEYINNIINILDNEINDINMLFKYINIFSF